MKIGKSVFMAISLILLFTFAVGCSENNVNPDKHASPLELVWKDAPDDTAAIVINQPSEQQLMDFIPSERLTLEDSAENFLLIPSDKVEEICIWKVEFDDTAFARLKMIYNNLDPQEDFILHLTAARPEGGPHFEITLIADEGEASYYIAYNGKDEDQRIEYVKSD